MSEVGAADAFIDDEVTLPPLPQPRRVPPPPRRPPAPPTTGGEGNDDFQEGEVVKITIGPFTDFTGTISEVDRLERTVTVVVPIFGRPTPVVLGSGDVQKA